MPKTILYEKNISQLRGSFGLRTNIFFHQKCLRHVSYLKHCHLILLSIYLRQSDFDGYQYVTTGRGLILRRSLIWDCKGLNSRLLEVRNDITAVFYRLISLYNAVRLSYLLIWVYNAVELSYFFILV